MQEHAYHAVPLLRLETPDLSPTGGQPALAVMTRLQRIVRAFALVEAVREEQKLQMPTVTGLTEVFSAPMLTRQCLFSMRALVIRFVHSADKFVPEIQWMSILQAWVSVCNAQTPFESWKLFGGV